MTPARIGGLVLAAASALALGALSRVPSSATPDGRARLRVAFSARPERVEQCRTLSAEELANVPVHMRQSQVCEGTTVRYRLEVLRDGRLLDSATLRGGGLRHDRQLYALRELPVASGPATVEVRLTRLGPGGRPDTAASALALVETTGALDRRQREADERRRRAADEVPAVLVLRESVTLAPREVLLVTYDQGARRLRAVRGNHR